MLINTQGSGRIYTRTKATLQESVLYEPQGIYKITKVTYRYKNQYFKNQDESI